MKCQHIMPGSNYEIYYIEVNLDTPKGRFLMENQYSGVPNNSVGW